MDKYAGKTITTFLSSGKDENNFTNIKGECTKLDDNTEELYVIELRYKKECRQILTQQIELNQEQFDKLQQELNSKYNLFHIPAKETIKVLKNWGLIKW